MSNRFDYVKYDDYSANAQAQFKRAFKMMEDLVTTLGQGRAQSLVLTKLEEAYMWVGKAIRDNQIDRNGGAELQEGRSNG